MQSAISSQSAVARREELLQDSLPGRVVLVVAATALVAACAHVSLPLPFTPVPLTLQNFAVILVGMALGPVAGFSAMVLYLAEGAMGMPVFSPHGPGGVAQLLGPTAGYLFSYPLAAAVAGWVVRAMRPVASRFTRAVIAGVLANVVIFTLAAGWLAHLLHLSASVAWTLAVAPFLLGEAIKITAAAGIFSTLQRWQRS
ncbi:MAG: BioY protein [Edaphobacter sp.]|jgi:biotin transport system substrate-specific component|nr:BioY protein [Edaphobacter sp.]